MGAVAKFAQAGNLGSSTRHTNQTVRSNKDNNAPIAIAMCRTISCGTLFLLSFVISPFVYAAC